MGGWFDNAGRSKWKRKPKDSKCTQKAEKKLQCPCICRVGEVKVQVVYHAGPSLEIAHDLPTAAHHHHHEFVHLHCEVEFDPEKDYAQVLAEARSHLKVTTTPDNATTSWTQARPPQHHLAAYKELQSKLGKPNKHSKFWRYLFFWQKSSHFSEEQVEAEFKSIFSSPPHPRSKIMHKGTSSEKRNANSNNSMPRPTRKSTSGPLNYHPRSTRNNNSGPLYTDGLPSVPFNIKHTKKSYSGPLGPMNCNNMNAHLSPYQPLHRPPQNSPLYSC